MESRLRKTSQFSSDLEVIVDHIARDTGNIIVHFLDAVEDTVELLRTVPHLGTSVSAEHQRFKSLRRISIGGFSSYMFLYDLRGDEVFILRVVHAVRDLNNVIWIP